ncbi:hypothetical protein MRX96_017429 [Rhipicephalus microplus]
MSPFMLFSKFISPEYLASLAELTARYALQKREEMDVTGVDIGQFSASYFTPRTTPFRLMTSIGALQKIFVCL